MRLLRRIRFWYLLRHVVGISRDEQEAFFDELDRGFVSVGDKEGRRRAATRAKGIVHRRR